MTWITPNDPGAHELTIVVRDDHGEAKLMYCDGVDPETGEVSVLDHSDDGGLCLDEASGETELVHTRVNLGADRLRIARPGEAPVPERTVCWHGPSQSLKPWPVPVPAPMPQT